MSDSRHHGKAGQWIIVAVGAAALLAAGGWMLLASMRQPPPHVDTDQAYVELETLQQRLQAAIANQREVTPIIADARALVRAHGDIVPARVTLAQALMMDGQKDPAYEQLVEALRRDPDQPAVRLLAGTLALELDQPAEAERHYRLAIDNDPQNGQHRLHLAKVQMIEGRLDDAQQTLLDALRIDSSLHAAHGMLANIYAEQGDLEAALEHIRQARERSPLSKPELRQAYTRRYAALLLKAGQPAEAMLMLRTLPIEMHFDPGVMAQMAACWAQLDEPARAAEHYEQALSYHPADEGAAALAAEWHLEADDLAAARRMIDQLRRINPRSPHLAELEARLNP